MKQTGIWMDYSMANIIHLLPNSIETIDIESEIEHFNPKGGSHSKSPWGPVDTTSESKLLERKKHQSTNYFKKIVEQLNDSTDVILMGPAEAKLQFNTFIKSIKTLNFNVKEIVTVDAMTDNQKVAKVRSLFSTV